MPAPTIAARMAALENAVASLVTVLTPATAAPVAAKAKAGPTKFADTEFGASILAKARVACGIPAHGATCNRTFGAASSGVTNHEPRIV